MPSQNSTLIREETTIKSGEAILKAFLARPERPRQEESDKPLPGIIVIHEIVGLTDHIKDMTSRLAEEGYATLALDLFSAGNTALCIWQCLAAVRQGTTDHFGVRYLQSALDYLSERPYCDSERLGAIGFCMGGNFAISLACEDKRIKTIAPFYGLTPAKMDVEKLCPVVGSYPAFDATRKSGEQLKAFMDKTTIAHDIKIYAGTTHCFMNKELPFMYNEAASRDAWERTLSFFSRYL